MQRGVKVWSKNEVSDLSTDNKDYSSTWERHTRGEIIFNPNNFWEILKIKKMKKITSHQRF